jgi:hypothetical protein
MQGSPERPLIFKLQEANSKTPNSNQKQIGGQNGADSASPTWFNH